mmetsp:Transcript_21617/g.69622  ORF Transcript_21617/g.69622 Transcript_21617/m.69622 type:complete len:288 (-) Transcript_21617:46-909(-)
MVKGVAPRVVSKWRQFGGWWTRYQHLSQACGCDMTFSVFVPPKGEPTTPLPALTYLSGLTCTDENFVQKAGAARRAAERGIALLAPDTSPRGLGVPGEDDSYDFGSAAGFYVDATAEPWAKGYNMESYVTEDLLDAVEGIVDVSNLGVTGHSMGGHGALTLALKHPGLFKSVSALAPICNPTTVPWGKKAFEGYLGSVDAGKDHDATELIAKLGAKQFDDILIDQGADDAFLVGDTNQLQPEAFIAACDAANQPVTVRFQEGYDHSYFFISSFIDDHVDFAADRLLK